MSVLPTKYRKGNSCNYEKSFETYVINNFNQQTYQTVLPFIKEVSQLRNMISFLQIPKTKDEINKQISLLVSYISYLDAITSLIPFGKTKNQMTLSFSWTEATTSKTTSSNSIDYEICSAKYNLAVAFILRGELMKKSLVDIELKEAMKDYQKAARVFQEIKDLHAKDIVKEGVPDFSESYIEMNINFCFGMGNKCIFDICVIKGLEDKLKSKQVMGAYYFFDKAANSSTSTPFDKSYYLHLSYLSKGLGYYYFYLGSINQVLTKSKGMGLMIGFLEASKQLLNNSLKDLDKIKLIINSDLVANTLSQLEVKLNDSKMKNDKYFLEPIVSAQSLPELEMDLSKMKGLVHEDSSSSVKFIHLLNHLVAPEYITVNINFTKALNQYIQEQISKFHTQKSIEGFLSERQLLNIGNNSPIKITLSNEIWNDIQEIQSKGGYDFLLNDLKRLDMKSNELKDKIQIILSKLYADDAENTKYQLLYGTDWTIISNQMYLKECAVLGNELSVIDNNKTQTYNAITNNGYLFSLLSLPKNQIESQLPGGNNSIISNPMTSTIEGNKLKSSLEALAVEQTKLVTIEKRIYTIANTPLHLSVLQKIKGNYSAEKALLEETKKLVNDVIIELESLHQVIQSCLETIDNDYQSFKLKLQQSSSGSSIDSNSINNIKSIYSEALNSLCNLLSAYTALNLKVIKTSDDSEGFIFAKNFNKESLINSLDSKARKNLAK